MLMSNYWQTFKVSGEDLLKRVNEIVNEGNVRRVVIKQGTNVVVEFPVTVGVVGALAAPGLAALGAMAALLSDCTIAVERVSDPPAAATPPSAPTPARRRRGSKASARPA
jgi:hypothetical protein